MKAIAEILSESTDFDDLVRRIEEEYGSLEGDVWVSLLILQTLWDSYQEEKAETVSLFGQEEDWFDEQSSVFQRFIEFINQQIRSNPDSVVPADEEQLARIESLVSGVKT